MQKKRRTRGGRKVREKENNKRARAQESHRMGDLPEVEKMLIQALHRPISDAIEYLPHISAVPPEVDYEGVDFYKGFDYSEHSGEACTEARQMAARFRLRLGRLKSREPASQMLRVYSALEYALDKAGPGSGDFAWLAFQVVDDNWHAGVDINLFEHGSFERAYEVRGRRVAQGLEEDWGRLRVHKMSALLEEDGEEGGSSDESEGDSEDSDTDSEEAEEAAYAAWCLDELFSESASEDDGYGA